MSMDMKVELMGLERLMRKLTPDLYAKPVRTLLTKAANKIIAEAKHRAPVAPGGGLLRRSITKEVDSAKVPTWAKVGSAVEYAPFQEYGTGLMSDHPGGKRGRHWPPGKALNVWAAKKGFTSGYHVAKIIGRRGGLRPVRYLREGLKASMPTIEALVDKALRQIQANWGK